MLKVKEKPPFPTMFTLIFVSIFVPYSGLFLAHYLNNKDRIVAFTLCLVIGIVSAIVNTPLILLILWEICLKLLN